MDSPKNDKTPRTFNIQTIFRWLKKHAIPLSGLFLAVAIIVTVGIVYIHNKEFFNNLSRYDNAGPVVYAITFGISVLLNATLIIPVSNMTIIFSLGALAAFNPILIGLAGGIGAGIGEMTGYITGRSGRELLTRNKIYNRVERWVTRWGWIAVFVFSLFPFIFDVVGIIAGAMRMPWWKFFLACWVGRTITYCVVAYLAYIGFNALPWMSS